MNTLISRAVTISVSISMVVSAFSCGLAARGDSYEFHSPGMSEKYGVSYQGFEGAAQTSSSTVTYHHRFGQETGIGSSTMQTESATVESMPGLSYTPTSVSPAITNEIQPQHFQRFASFSQSMLTTPALRPPESHFSAPEGLASIGTHFSGALDRLKLFSSGRTGTFSIGGAGRGQSRGSLLDLQLTNPFEDLNDDGLNKE